MTTFKGFDDWVEIFRGGKVTDSAGLEHDGNYLIDKALSEFDPAKHEAPVVIGHPKDNAPAYAWVESLKKEARDGANVLMAKFKGVVPEFGEIVEKGLYKKRSAAFYPDGSLRHVGFLGAAPPAIKGLADLKFDSADDSIVFEFAEPWTWRTIADVFKRLRDWLIETQGREVADSVIPTWDTEIIDEERRRAEKPPETEGEDDMAFTEAQVKEAAEKAAEEARKSEREKMQLEFSETRAQEKRDAARKENRAWVEAKVKDGTIPPVIAKIGIAEFMDALDTEGEFEFSEGKKQAPAGWFREFVTELFEGSFSHLFAEFATKKTAASENEDEGAFPPNLTSKV